MWGMGLPVPKSFAMHLAKCNMARNQRDADHGAIRKRGNG